ncbi:helix-turn-helix transcriptional regulator [Luteimicrobium subarcticum]|uniref:Putative ArsR family transcriptional regulator n=1 Tax=Luteimicrobium subarcticum TaxID=620910 RepID=A0A2M8WWI4_9MICO|nr:helix-turn-helix domain-containing protein [Luteimicrobium subarcticum]PJI95277.1 putative ArsR family transcriptional regulator [Luteimicrobium subarcticum]
MSTIHVREAETAASATDASTRERVLALVAERGPVSAAALATELGLTATGVRRHLVCLEEDGLIAVHDIGSQPHAPAQRGRPARRYVATRQGQAHMAGEYPELAAAALRFLRQHGGERAVEAFAAERYAAMAERYRGLVDADDVEGRVDQLAAALAGDGYAASVRPVPSALPPTARPAGSSAGRPAAVVHTVQLCQGHCPVQQIAAEFPQLCEAEAQVFAELLGTHVQRLSTLAGGGHVCTTNVPVVRRPSAPTGSANPPKPPSAAQEG